MLKNTSLRTKLISGFSFISFIVLLVAIIGWKVNVDLSNGIRILSTNSMPSIMGLWKINEGQTQIESSERALLNPQLTLGERNAQIARIKNAWKQIDEGFKEYEPTEKTDEEKKIYADFQTQWNEWKQNHENFMDINKEFQSLGILNPVSRELELLQLNQANTQEMLLVKRAKTTFEKLRQKAEDNKQSFNDATKLLLADIKLNETFGIKTYKEAQRNAARGGLFLVLVLIIGPTTAIIFGIVFSKQVADKIEELVKISKSIANSDVEKQSSQDEIIKLQTAFYTLAAKMAELVNIAQKIASGDLTSQIELSDKQDEMSKLQMAFYTMNKDLNSLIRRIQQSGVQITTSSTQIAASGKQLEATVTEQLASSHEVTATAQEIAATSINLVKMMGQVSETTKITAHGASDSLHELRAMEDTMRQLTEATNSITSKLGVMNKKASNINNVVVTITKVADQTSILSLNAAIEAEKAGEYGAGFAVVAREIRRLANQTAVATLEIEQIVKDMQSAVSVGVMEMDKFSNSVNNTVEQVNRISNQITKVINQVQSLPPQFSQVSESMEEQSQGATQISQAMTQLTEASEQTVDALRETNLALDQLEEAAHSLRAEIAHFHIK